LIGFLPDRDFRRCVQHYNGDLRRREGGFSGWDRGEIIIDAKSFGSTVIVVQPPAQGSKSF
jgi:hypothetical protein